MEIKSIQAAKIEDSKRAVVIVTGCSGQDGSHMVDYLLEFTDYIIYGAARRLSVQNHDNLKHISNDRFVLFNMDVTDPHSITKAVEVLNPDYFINFAAQSFVGSSWDFPEQTWQTNCTAILHMLEAIRNKRPSCRFYNAGSSEEMGDVLYSPQGEEHPPRPRSPYGASKVAARQLVKVYRESYGLYAVQGWLYNHEGTRRGEDFVTRKISKGVVRILRDIKSKKQLIPISLGNLDSKRDWGDSEDFVKAVWMMMNQEKYSNKVKDYIVGTGEEHTIREFVETAFKEIGIEGKWEGTGVNETFSNEQHGVLVKVDPEFYRPCEVNKLLANYSAIKTDLGWKPTTTFNQLVKKMVDADRLIA